MRRLRRAALAVILIALAACDNVEWGGARIAIVRPPAKGAGRAADTAREAERLPEGPVLYHVRATGAAGVMVPVAEIAGDSLRPLRATDWVAFGRRFIAQHLRQGTEFALFHAGIRRGTLVLRSASMPDSTVCPRLPRASGILELTANEQEAAEFLALAKPHAPGTRRQRSPPPAPDRRLDLIAPILAEQLLRARAAPLPSNWQRARAQLVPLPLPGATDPGFAASFLVDDTLGTGLDDEGHSVFFVARPVAQTGYDTIFVRYADYARVGKEAPRLVDFLDWNRDDRVELLLEVFGSSDAWFEAVGQIDGRFQRVFDGRCERPQLRVPAVTQDTGAPSVTPPRRSAPAAERPAPAAAPELLGRPAAPRARPRPAPADTPPPAPRDTLAPDTAGAPGSSL